MLIKEIIDFDLQSVQHIDYYNTSEKTCDISK